MHPYMNDVLIGSCSATGEGVTATEKIFQAVGRLSKFQVEIGVKKVIGSVLLGTFKMISVVPSSICQATVFHIIPARCIQCHSILHV